MMIKRSRRLSASIEPIETPVTAPCTGRINGAELNHSNVPKQAPDEYQSDGATGYPAYPVEVSIPCGNNFSFTDYTLRMRPSTAAFVIQAFANGMEVQLPGGFYRVNRRNEFVRIAQNEGDPVWTKCEAIYVLFRADRGTDTHPTPYRFVPCSLGWLLAKVDEIEINELKGKIFHCPYVIDSPDERFPSYIARPLPGNPLAPPEQKVMKRSRLKMKSISQR